MSKPDTNELKLAFINAENLFIFLDEYKNQNLETITEAEWQSLSFSSVENKNLLKTKKLASAIKDMAPDILMLAEVGGLESLKNFNKYFLEDQYIEKLIEGNSDRGIDVGYLIKKTLPFRFEIWTHKDRPLNFLYPHEEGQKKTHYFSRDVAELRMFSSEKTEPELVFLLTHLKSKLDTNNIDLFGRKRRKAELKSLVEIYNEKRKAWPGPVPFIVAGDLNGNASPNDTDEEFFDLYELTDLKDTLELSDIPIEERYSQIQVYLGGQKKMNQVDFIFISPELVPKVNKKKSKIYRYKDEFGMDLPMPQTLEEKLLLPSDHYPVMTTLRF